MRKTYQLFFIVNLFLLFVISFVFTQAEAGLEADSFQDLDLPSQTEGEDNAQATFTPIPASTAPAPTATEPPPRTDPQSFYVSKNGGNQDGESWDSAWNEFDQIDWSIIIPGDTILVDGGAIGSSMTYTSSLKPLVVGTEDAPVRIELSHEEGRNGQAILFGGNSVLLPECGQLEWDESELEMAGGIGIEIDAGVSNVIIDGTKRRGFVIHGWGRSGVLFDPDRSDNGVDDNSRNITLRFMEIYNNGSVEKHPDLAPSSSEEEAASAPELYYPFHGSPGIKLSGIGHKFEYLEIHDNAADAIQSNFTNPAGGVFNNIDDISISHSWFYNQRAHSGIDNSPETEVCTAEDRSGCDEDGAPSMSNEYHNYPASPTERRESFNWCTHNDAIQIYSSNDLNRLELQNSIIGPNMMNALILGDKGEENTTAWVNELVMRDVVVTRFTNNALGMNNEKPNVGQNWLVEQSTIYGHFNKQNMGSFSLQSNAAEIEHRIVNTVNVFGRGEFVDGNVQFENNCDFNMYTGSLEGVVADPQFAQVDGQSDIFENDLSVDFATVFTEDYTPTNRECGSAGSRLTSVAQLLGEFDAEAQRILASKPIIEPTPLPTVVVAEDTPIPIVDNSSGGDSGGATDSEQNQDGVEAGRAGGLAVIELSPLQIMANDSVIVILAIIALFIFFVLLGLTFAVWRLKKQDE